MQKILDLPTPCLVLDLDRFESNLNKMTSWVRDCGLGLRPHAKTHKCVEIARRQLQKGALGICVATVAEAEVMARAGIRGLLITGEMVGEPKISRLIRIVLQAPDTMVVVDNEANVQDLQRAAESASVEISLLIDLDIGQNGVTHPLAAQGINEVVEQGRLCTNGIKRGLVRRLQRRRREVLPRRHQHQSREECQRNDKTQPLHALTPFCNSAACLATLDNTEAPISRQENRHRQMFRKPGVILSQPVIE